LNRMLELRPTHFGAMWQKAVALERSGQLDRAVEAWGDVVDEATAKGYPDVKSAEARLTALRNRR